MRYFTVVLAIFVVLSFVSLALADVSPETAETETAETSSVSSETSQSSAEEKGDEEALCQCICDCAIKGSMQVRGKKECVCPCKCEDVPKEQEVKAVQVELKEYEPKTKDRDYMYVATFAAQTHALDLQLPNEQDSMFGYRLEASLSVRLRITKYFVVEPALSIHKSNLGGGFAARSYVGLAAFKNEKIIFPVLSPGYQVASEGKGFLIAFGGEYEWKKFILGGEILSESFDGWVFVHGQDWQAQGSTALRGYLKYKY